MRVNYISFFCFSFLSFLNVVKAQYPDQLSSYSAIINHPYLHDSLPVSGELNGQYGLNVGDQFPSNFSLYSNDSAYYNRNSILSDALQHNRAVVVLPVNVTCPGARMWLEVMRNLNEETLSKIHVVIINISEAHPNAGPSPFAAIEGNSFPVAANIPDYEFQQTEYYGDQYGRIDTMKSLYSLPENWLFLLDGPECPFGRDFVGPFGLLIINPISGIIEKEFPNVVDGFQPDINELLNSIDQIVETVGVLTDDSNGMEGIIAPNPVTPYSKWISNTAAEEVCIFDMSGQFVYRFNSTNFTGIEMCAPGFYIACIYNKEGILIGRQRVEVE